MKKYLFIILLVGVWSCEKSNQKKSTYHPHKFEKDDSIAVLAIVNTYGFLDSSNFIKNSTKLIYENSGELIWNLSAEEEKIINDKVTIQWYLYKDLMKKAGYSDLDKLNGRKLSADDFEKFLTDDDFQKLQKRNTALDSIFVRVMINEHGIMNKTEFNKLSNKFNLETIIEQEIKTQMVYGGKMPSRNQIEKDFSEPLKYFRENQWAIYRSEIKKKFNKDLPK